VVLSRQFYGLASNTMLNGVSVARRNRVNPPCSTTTWRNRFSPACAPNAGPFFASDTGTCGKSDKAHGDSKALHRITREYIATATPSRYTTAMTAVRMKMLTEGIVQCI
jgi:hypothetical protein